MKDNLQTSGFSQAPFSLENSLSIHLGAFFIAVVSYLPYFFLDSTFWLYLFYFAFACMGIMSTTEILTGYKKIEFSDGKLILHKGLRRKKTVLTVADIKNIEIEESELLTVETPKTATPFPSALKTVDGNKPQKIKHQNEIKKWQPQNFFKTENIIITAQNGKIFKIASSTFDHDDLKFFAKKLQTAYFEHLEHGFEKVLWLKKQCEANLENDRKLLADLQEDLRTSYFSGYQAFIIPDETKLKSESPEFTCLDDNRREVAFYADKFLALDEEEKIIIKTLVSSVRENIQLIQTRAFAYEKIQMQLNDTAEKLKRREKLEQISRKLGNLQSENLANEDFKKEMSFRADTYSELEKIKKDINNAETIDDLNYLREYFKLKTDD